MAYIQFILTVITQIYHQIIRASPCSYKILSPAIYRRNNSGENHDKGDNRYELYQEVLDGTYVEEPEVERLVEMRTLIDQLKIRVNLLGHHISNTVPITGALPDDKTAILCEFDKAIAQFPEKELKTYRSRIWHL